MGAALTRFLAELELLTTVVDKTAIVAVTFNDTTTWIFITLAFLVSVWVLLSKTKFIDGGHSI